MNLVSLVSRCLLGALLFLISLSGVPFISESATEFMINGKPVPKVVAKVNGTKLTSDLLKREMIAYRLLANRQGENIETEDEGKIAQGLLMKAIDDELIFYLYNFDIYTVFYQNVFNKQTTFFFVFLRDTSFFHFRTNFTKGRNYLCPQ